MDVIFFFFALGLKQLANSLNCLIQNCRKMKKLVYGSLFLVLVGIGFSGCKKEEMVNMSNSPDQYSGKSMGDLTSSITVENGMLKFRDMEP